MSRPVYEILIYVVLLFVACCVGVLWWYVCTLESASIQYPTSGTSIVLFGGSLAYGEGATEGNDIASILKQRIYREVVNLGVKGETTTDALARLPYVLKHDPRIVIVLYGGTDVRQRVSMVATFANLDAIVSELHSRGIGVVLVGEHGGVYAWRYAREYERIAKKYGALYVSDVLRGLVGKNEYMSDAVYPNNLGYQKIVDRIEPQVQRMLAGTWEMQ